MHHHHLVESWSRLDEAVTSGQSITPRAGHTAENTRESFLMGMFNIAMDLAPRIVPHIDLSGRKHLLDMGGGPGTYAIFFCQNTPGLRATVYDLPTTRPFAEKTIKQFDLTHRIDFQEGNYVAEGIEGRYDVAWLSHILHGESPETCQEMIHKTVSVLDPGGMIIIHDFILEDSMDRPLFPALFSLNMLLESPGGQSYSEKQITAMLTTAGVKDVHRIALSSEENSGLLAGVV
jgi:cyclopropane fatty-acyl-phospholipid synthase-like methyltransferase